MSDHDPLPLDVQVAATERGQGFTTYDLSYASPPGGRVPAFLVVPDGSGPFAGLIFVHPGQGSRATFRAEAESLAPSGVVCLTIDAPFADPRHPRPTKPVPYLEAAAAEVALYRQFILELRRGVDLLTSRSDVEAGRIGYVGHSYGATLAGPLVAEEPRIRAFVLMAGYPSYTHAWRHNPHPSFARARESLGPERLEEFCSYLAPFDADRYVGALPSVPGSAPQGVAAPAPLLFQWATQDEYITQDDARRFFAIAREPKEQLTYEAGHFFAEAPKAQGDRRRWLGEKLGFAP